MGSIPEFRKKAANKRWCRPTRGGVQSDAPTRLGPGAKAGSPSKPIDPVPGRAVSPRSLAARRGQKRLQLRHQAGEHFQRQLLRGITERLRRIGVNFNQ